MHGEQRLTLEPGRIYNVDTMGTLISRWGNSLAVRIPKAALDAANLREGDSVAVTTADGAIIVRRAPKIDIDAMIAAITPETLPDENFDPTPVGRELW
jgi:antitoxin MazE